MRFPVSRFRVLRSSISVFSHHEHFADSFANTCVDIVDQEFPPLPKRTESQTAVHSRVSSVQSSLGIRTGTPKVPPGLERIATPKVPPGLEKNVPSRFSVAPEDLHAHPVRIQDQTENTPHKKQVSNPGIIPVVPAIPAIQYRAIDKPETPPTETETGKEDVEVGKGRLPEIKPTGDETAIIVPQTPKVETQTVPEEVVKVENTLHTETTAEVTAPVADSPVETESAVVTAQKGSDQQTEQMRSEPKVQADEPVVMSPPSDVVPDVPEEKVPGSDIVSTLVGTPVTTSASPQTEKKAEIKRPALRTLNITSEMVETLRRSESQAPLSTTTEKSTAFPTLAQIRQSSRQPSISVSTNISRPSTPAASDRFGLMSQDVSRAGSPPPGGFVVGSAPSRQKTKNQAKKDRREKAKKATETSETGSVTAVATPPAADEVGPIVARQKKQKKSKATNGASTVATQRTADEDETKQDTMEVAGTNAHAPSPQKRKTEQMLPKKDPEPLVVEKPPTPKPATPPPASPEPLPVSYTLRDFYTDASKLQSQYQNDEQITDEQIRSEIQDLLTSKVSPFNKLLQEMVASGDLVKDHPLFSPAPFTSSPYKLPSDHRRGQAYLDGNNYSSNDVFGMIYLPQKEKKALYHGHAVSIADPAPAPTNNGSTVEPREDLLRRCLITPTGWVLRHLSRDESEKLLDLEERRQMYLEEFGDLGRMDRLGALEENDYVNLEGGFDEISRFGDRHGVCWVMDQDNSRGGRKASRLNENDYGLGEMPIDADDFDGDEDQYDDPEDEGDEDIDDEELDGEDLIQRAVADDDRYDDEDDDLGSFANLTGDPGMSMTLPPLPPSMMMNMNMDMPISSGWDTTNYPERTAHTMYGSLNTPNTYGAPYTSTGPGYVMDEMLPPTSELPVPRASNTNILPPIRQAHGHEAAAQEGVRVNLRAMNEEELSRRVKEKQREMENARRESERLEKMMAKKGKDLGRWREGMFRGLAAVGGS